MSILEILRQNDPEDTEIRIELRDETSDAALARALEQNPFVTDIVLDLEGVEQTDWDSLLRVMAARANLRKVTLLDAYDSEDRTAPAALVRSILRAIQQNTSIRSVLLNSFRLPIEISTLVDNTSSLTSFIISDCDMNPAERQQGARSLAVALQRNTNIETLELDGLEDVYAIPILEGLRSNTSLKTFIWKGNVWGGQTAPALQRLLESTTSLQRFELVSLQFSGDTFQPIAHAITRSASVSELKFEQCQFQERNSSAFLQSILQNKHNLTSLCLHHCQFGIGQVHRDSIISILSRPDSPLQCFEFLSFDLDQQFSIIQFDNLLRAIEKSKLERFKMGLIRYRQQLQALAQSIPSMRIRELEVDIQDHLVRENSRQCLLQAARNNFSLRRVKGKRSDGSDFFDSDDDKQRLAFYANRNECLDQWVKKPETSDQKVWPEALSLAESAGPEALFRGLRSVLGRDYVSLPRGRKRKRTQYYTPS